MLSDYQVYNYEMRISFLKKHVKFRRMIKMLCSKYAPRLLYIFPSFERFVNTTPVKIFLFCCEAIFSRLRTNQRAAQQVRDPAMQTSGNRKEPSLVSKQHKRELPSWMLPTCREPVLPCVMNGMWWDDFVLHLSVFCPFFKQWTVQIDQLLLVTFSINRFPRF